MVATAATGLLQREVIGTAITRLGSSAGRSAKHAAGDAERSEGASAARSAREADVAAAMPSQGFDAGRAGDRRGPRCTT